MGLIVHESYINSCSKKILAWRKWVILIQDPECHILYHNSGSAVRIILQFCTMKGAKRDMEIILMVFLKEILLYSQQFGHFGTKMVWCLFTLNLLSGFLLILLKKGTKRYMKFFLVFFKEKSLLGQFDLFKSLFNQVWSKLSQATVTIGSLKIQDIIKIFKQSGDDFSGKHLCGRQCTQILCDVYVWRSIFNIESYGFMKKLLQEFVA